MIKHSYLNAIPISFASDVDLHTPAGVTVAKLGK